MSRQRIRVAIIGCGAVAEIVHLPALAKIGLRPALLVDKNLHRAESLARQFQVPRCSDDYRAEWGEFDAAIVALPHHLHAPVGAELLSRGIHVLMEKPMAMTSAECLDMITAARQSASILAVGLVRRFLPAANWLKVALQANVLGKVETFDFQEGIVYNWPVASDFMFRNATGGGVLWDTGVHVLDLLLWWLGEVADFTYQEDSQGGVESDCEINLMLASGAKGFVALSRVRNLRNTAVIKGSRGEIEVSLFGNRLDANPASLLEFKVNHWSQKYLRTRNRDKIFTLQLQDWLDAIVIKRKPFVSGEDAARSVALIEALSTSGQSLEHPW